MAPTGDVALAARIKLFRRMAGLSQTQLAQIVGVTPSAVSHWEAGESDPTVDRLEAVATACGVELRTFFGELPAEKAS